MSDVYVETCSCGARASVSSSLAPEARKELLGGFRTAHQGCRTRSAPQPYRPYTVPSPHWPNRQWESPIWAGSLG